jgi:Domain of unknown function (DUF4384)
MRKQKGFDLKLERYLLGELPAAEMAVMEKELIKSAALRKQLETLKKETQDYYRAHPRLRSRALSEEPGTEPWFRKFFAPRVIGGLAFAAACIAAVLYFPKANTKKDEGKIAGKPETNLIALNGHDNENTVHTKGLKPALFLSVVRDGKAQTLAGGDTVAGGDEIQIAYRASGNRYGIIVSVDAEKSVSLHFPESEKATQELKGGAQVKIPHAFKLDDRPGSERFFFIAADEPLPLKKIIKTLARTGKIHKELPKDAQQASIQLKKT